MKSFRCPPCELTVLVSAYRDPSDRAELICDANICRVLLRGGGLYRAFYKQRVQIWVGE